MARDYVDTVTFDLWNTLIAHDELYDGRLRAARTRGIVEVLQDAGYDVPGEAVDRAYDSSDQFLEERWASYHDIDTEGQVAILLKCMGIEPAPALVRAVADPYANAVLHVEPFLVAGTMEALEQISAEGMRLALISNTGRTPGSAMRKVIGKLGLLDRFEVTTFSNEAGYLKPHPRIFELTLSRMGARPERTVHVGDHDVLDVQGAKDFGMKSVRVLQYAGSRRDRPCAPDACVETMAGVPGAIFGLRE